MKRTFFLILTAALIALVGCDAQKREINSIESEAKKGNIAEALERIETAIEGEAATLPNAWVVRAEVYMNIFMSEDPEINELHPDPLGEAYKSLKKAKELDEKNQLFLVIQQKELMLSQMFNEAGAVSFNEGRYPLASSFFYHSYEVSESFGTIDTLTLYYAAVSAERGMMYKEANEYLHKLVELEYDEPGVYVSLINVAGAMEDHAEAEKWIEKAKEKYGEERDISLIFAEANYYLKSGNSKKAEKAINIAIEKQPDNPSLYYALGGNYERIYSDTTYTDKDREEAYDKAVNAYKKSLEIDPEQFDVVFSLGALYFNKGIQIFEKADEKLREDFDFKEYKKSEEKFKEMWLKSQPYLEKALEMIEPENPNYSLVVNSLRELYARTGQDDELKLILELIEAEGIEIENTEETENEEE
ncbi:MAG: tetratricopeptide repeat protein [Bacteroidota bacterium]